MRGSWTHVPNSTFVIYIAERLAACLTLVNKVWPVLCWFGYARGWQEKSQLHERLLAIYRYFRGFLVVSSLILAAVRSSWRCSMELLSNLSLLLQQLQQEWMRLYLNFRMFFNLAGWSIIGSYWFWMWGPFTSTSPYPLLTVSIASRTGLERLKQRWTTPTYVTKACLLLLGPMWMCLPMYGKTWEALSHDQSSHRLRTH